MKWIKIQERDNVAVALEDLELSDCVPKGHKFALKDIESGGLIIKYGAAIGKATKDIRKGQWVHVHNVKTLLDQQVEYHYEGQPQEPFEEQADPAYFDGYLREDGSCGIRNEIWIIATVGCVNSVAQEIAREAQAYGQGKVDGIHAVTHPYGCSQMGEDQEHTLKALAAMVMHPNAGGVLLLGLGCENCNFDALEPYVPTEIKKNAKRLKWLRCQDVEHEVKEGARLVRELVDYARVFKRRPLKAENLVIGLKCGGSDGLSGITANPLVGAFSDQLCGQGGSVILTEVPEMFGAETFLMERCKNREIFQQTVQLINDFKAYFQNHHQVIYENPSPGNKTGGITTLEDKSMGCVQKGGRGLVKGVLAYGEPIKENGLNLLQAPGNDLVASTALALSGAHMILFTTGRGTPFGSMVPTIKISSNQELYEQKREWIDYNGQRLLDARNMDQRKQVEQEFFQYVLAVASGQQTKSEKRQYRDIAIFKQGVTL